LGVLEVNGDRSKDVIHALAGLRKLLDNLDLDKSHCASAAEKRWKNYLENCKEDWRWAYLQTVVRLALTCVEEDTATESDCTLAQSSLEEAIPGLEEGGFSQPLTQGLSSILARCYLRGASPRKSQAGGDSETLGLLTKAFLHARSAVEMRPGGARERLTLLEVLASFGDPHEMEIQAEIATDLDSSPETLRTIGQCFWNRITSLPVKSHRRRVLRRAAKFFKNAVAQIE